MDEGQYGYRGLSWPFPFATLIDRSRSMIITALRPFPIVDLSEID